MIIQTCKFDYFLSIICYRIDSTGHLTILYLLPKLFYILYLYLFLLPFCSDLIEHVYNCNKWQSHSSNKLQDKELTIEYIRLFNQGLYLTPTSKFSSHFTCTFTRYNREMCYS